jgi:hypothetical protein
MDNGGRVYSNCTLTYGRILHFSMKHIHIYSDVEWETVAVEMATLMEAEHLAREASSLGAITAISE